MQSKGASARDEGVREVSGLGTVVSLSNLSGAHPSKVRERLIWGFGDINWEKR